MSLTDVIRESVLEPRNDGKLHFSSHLQHDRHTVLYYNHGYPSQAYQPWANVLPLFQGTAMHEELHRIMNKHYTYYYPEYPIEASYPGLPQKWVGTADAYFENDDDFWLVDYKTISGAGITFLNDPKSEHVMQVSAYYRFGQYKPNRVGIYYLPTSVDYKRQMHEPRFYEIDPLPETVILDRMYAVAEAIYKYNADKSLPPIPNGEYKWKQNKRNKCWDLTYKPHYANMYCPWRNEEDDPCGCSKDKSYKVGSWSKSAGVIEGNEEIILENIETIPEQV